MKIIRNLLDSFKQYNLREMRNAYIYLTPLLAVIFIFVFIPVAGTFVNSLYKDITFMPPREFVGLSNYGKAFGLPNFWGALRFTMLFTFTTVAFEAVFGMAFAVLLNEPYKGRGTFRTIVLIPWAIPTIISARLWQFIYNFEYGILNYLLINTGLASENVDWIGNATSAFWSICITDIWKTTPFITIILLAGLQAIPLNLYKQGKIDGCPMFKRFSKITLPLVRGVLAISLIFRTIDAIRIFDLVYALTGGGPSNSTETLSLIGYKYFANGNYGMGSTVSIITFIIGFTLSIIYIKAVGKKNT